MADGDSIAGAVADTAKDFGKGLVSEIISSATSAVKGAGQQITGAKTEEDEAKEKQDKIITFNRIKQIEAEMEQIRQAQERKTGPQITQKSQSAVEFEDSDGKPKVLDEASRQAVGRAEQGRNFKG